MTKAIVKDRVAELSATLSPLAEPYNDCACSEMWGILEEFIGYNCRYNYYYGIGDYSTENSFSSCVLQSVEEYQVLRFYQLDAYMSGEGTKKYDEDSALHADDDDEDWFENQADPDQYYDELEIRECFEYKQIWIDRSGNCRTIVLAPSFVDGTESFIKSHSLQSWISNPLVSKVILDNVEEWSSYCYAYNEQSLEFFLSQTSNYLSINEPVFYDVICKSHLYQSTMPYYNTFRIAHRHGFEFPTDYNQAFKYLGILNYLKMDGELKGKDFLNAPYYICPTDIDKEWEKIEKKKAEIERKKEMLRIQREEKDFAENHSYLFGIDFDSEHFHFSSLDSIEAYLVEGEIMHHCIYKCKFYEKHHYLSMHIADFEGNRVATCTINVESRTINQIQPIGNGMGFLHTYGIEWTTTDDYKEIWRTLMARMHTFPMPSVEENNDTTTIQIAV